MNLSERKRRILRAVIDDYIRTAEPVGSSYILNNYDFGISSATIRNEMADLEESGYLDKPHTSAGRVPSPLGYRVYVNELMNNYTLTVNEIEIMTRALKNKYLVLENIVNDISNTMSYLTNYTTIVSTPVLQSNKIRKIKFVSIDKNTFVMIVIIGDSVVRNTTIKLKTVVSSQVLEKLGNYLESVFTGKEISTITTRMLINQKSIIPMEDEILDPVFNFLSKLTNSSENFNIVSRGEANIFNFPEFKNVERTKEFFELIRNIDKSFLENAIFDSKDNINILIEEEYSGLKDLGLSMVSTNYKLNGETRGGIVIIGPSRMNYSKVVAMLEFFTSNLNKYLNDCEE